MITKVKDVVSRKTAVDVSTSDYLDLLKDLKYRIQSTQIKAAVKVNKELINLYWEIGTSLNLKIKKQGWGAKVLSKLAKDLKNIFPSMKGFSYRNLYSMVQFANEYTDFEIVQALPAQITWTHNMLIIQKISGRKEREWYIRKTIENSWSYRVLDHWIDSNLYQRDGKAVTNFKETMPKIKSDLANQTIKDPYIFDFLTIREKHDERELEDSLVNHIQQFLLELGQGFAFVGRQYHLEVGKKDYYIDLLFYHLKLRSYCVVELKNTEFKPEYVGKMNFYLSAVDDLVKHKSDEPTIGMILCKTRDSFTAEYALRDVNKPIGISGYETKILNSLPKNLKGSLPTIKELEEKFLKNSM
jgi:predicted nuclease of restriction endonuclease-like (RecB) superfamily